MANTFEYDISNNKGEFRTSIQMNFYPIPPALRRRNLFSYLLRSKIIKEDHGWMYRHSFEDIDGHLGNNLHVRKCHVKENEEES
jgi:hypothetical protein